MAPRTELLHATCVVLEDCGVLLLGPSGSGKSDLALRLMERPDLPGVNIGAARLVADDQVSVVRDKTGQLVAAAPEQLSGKLEIRGLGIMDAPFVRQAPVGLAVELVPREKVERFPLERDYTATIAGEQVPLIFLHAFAASTPAKLRYAVRALKSGWLPGNTR